MTTDKARAALEAVKREQIESDMSDLENKTFAKNLPVNVNLTLKTRVLCEEALSALSGQPTPAAPDELAEAIACHDENGVGDLAKISAYREKYNKYPIETLVRALRSTPPAITEEEVRDLKKVPDCACASYSCQMDVRRCSGWNECLDYLFQRNMIRRAG